jgi:Cu/Ag efflux protein CusF
MNMNRKLLIISIILFTIIFSSIYSMGQDNKASEKPGILEAVVTTIEATVEAVDHDARKVTLKGPEGKTVTIDVDEQVKNLPQVEVGDLVTVEYIEAVTIQVFAPGEVTPGTTVVTTAGSAEPGQKPAGVAMEEITIVATIDAIDKANQLVTLKGAEGKVKTVKARNPANLEKVKVGDKVMITYTEAIGISVTE